MTLGLADCYAVCRTIARKEARNFYYAFVALPEAKRNAICAVYAFMRHADDLADDESMPHDERRTHLKHWLDSWHAATNGSGTDNPVFIALLDAQKRFEIPSALLDKLVQGTTMDLDASRGSSDDTCLETYQTFDDLYGYCYLVASVVGLVCIRIFGYRDAAAERLAEETGVAFQLTNILRDIKEDALRRRIYIPVEDLDRFSTSPTELASIGNGGAMNANHRALLAFEAQRARRYYASAEKLLPLIAADSRPALWVLVSIYSRLLRRIEKHDYDVFSAKISIPTYEKLWILFRGICGVLLNRLQPAA